MLLEGLIKHIKDTMVHKESFVPLDELPERRVAHKLPKGFKGSLLNKFKTLQTRMSRDKVLDATTSSFTSTSSTLPKAPLAQPEESRMTSMASIYKQIQMDRSNTEDSRKSPLARLRKRFLSRQYSGEKAFSKGSRKDERDSRSEKQKSSLLQAKSKSVDDELDDYSDYTEVLNTVSIQSTPAMGGSFPSACAAHPQFHSDKLLGNGGAAPPKLRDKSMERRILGGSYQIRVVRRPHSLDLERNVERERHMRYSQISVLEETVQDYKDGFFDEIGLHKVELVVGGNKNSHKPRARDNKPFKAADKSNRDLKRDHSLLEDVQETDELAEMEEQQLEISMAKEEEHLNYTLNLRPLERTNHELKFPLTEEEVRLKNLNLVHRDLDDDRRCDREVAEAMGQCVSKSASPDKKLGLVIADSYIYHHPPPPLLLHADLHPEKPPKSDELLSELESYKSEPHKPAEWDDGRTEEDDTELPDVVHEAPQGAKRPVHAMSRMTQLEGVEEDGRTESDLNSEKLDSYDDWLAAQDRTARMEPNSSTASISEGSIGLSQYETGSTLSSECDVEEGMQWVRNRPIVRHHLARETLDSFYPRILPFGLLTRCQHGEFTIPHSEYMVTWSNGFVAIGVLKSADNYGGQPLVVQFGNWYSNEAAKLYPGCTVLVGRYAKIKEQSRTREIVGPDNFKLSNLTDKSGIPVAQVFATKWALLNDTVPTLVRRLGRVDEFRATRRQHGQGYRLFGVVVDVETGKRYLVRDDSWPEYIREPVNRDHPVVLTFIRVDFAYVSVKCEFADLVLPTWCQRLERAVLTSKPTEVFAWVDTHYVQ